MNIYSPDFIIVFLINLVLTFLSYCTVPIILRIFKGKFEYKKGHKIILINTAIVWFILLIIKIEQGANTVSGAVILYYFINKAILLKPKYNIEKIKKDETISETKEKKSLSFSDEKEVCGNVFGNDLKVQESIEPDKAIETIIKDTGEKKISKKERDKLLIDHLLETEQKLKIGLIISIIIIIILGIICLSIALNSNTKELEKEISSLKSKISKLTEENIDYSFENTKLQIKSDFIDENVVFVIEGYGKYYYTYEQMEQVTQGLEEYSYWAYNKEQAKGLGYKPWKK